MTAGNMHLHTAEGKIVRYEQPTDIIADFFPLRLKFYAKRKASLVERAAADLQVLDNKVRCMTCYTCRSSSYQGHRLVCHESDCDLFLAEYACRHVSSLLSLTETSRSAIELDQI